MTLLSSPALLLATALAGACGAMLRFALDRWLSPLGILAANVLAALLLGAAAALVVLGFLLDGLPWWLWVPGLALILGSLVSLFRALPEERSDDDDGAQV